MVMKNIKGRILFPEGVQWEQRAEKQNRPGPWDDWWYQNQSYENSVGVDVNEDSSLTYFAVWACRKIISEDLGSIPLQIYRRDGESRIKAMDHPLYPLLHDSPNDEMSAMQLRETMQGHVLSFGNAYAQVIRNYRDQPVALWPLNPGNMEVTRDGNNRLAYEYRLTDTNRVITFPKEEIFHLAGWGFNGLIGYNPIKYWAETIGSGMAEQEFQGNTFKNGAFPTIAVSHPAPKAPNPEGRADFRRELAKEYGGRQNAGKILTLWEGMKADKLSMTSEDAQLIESRKLTWLQICAIHRVPPHKVMNLYHATYTNIENQDIDYAKSTIRPWAVRWEQAINLQLLDRSTEYYAEHNIEGLVRGDLASRYNAYSVGRQWGWLSVNDIRTLENMNPIPAGGDEYLVPMNMTPVDREPEPLEEPKNEAEETERAVKTLLRLKLAARK